MLWVILGHAYFCPLLFPVKDFTFLEEKFKGILIPVVYGGFFAVDVFFFLSAFLATYLMIGKLYVLD